MDVDRSAAGPGGRRGLDGQPGWRRTLALRLADVRRRRRGSRRRSVRWRSSRRRGTARAPGGPRRARRRRGHGGGARRRAGGLAAAGGRRVGPDAPWSCDWTGTRTAVRRRRAAGGRGRERDHARRRGRRTGSMRRCCCSRPATDGRSSARASRSRPGCGARCPAPATTSSRSSPPGGRPLGRRAGGGCSGPRESCGTGSAASAARVLDPRPAGLLPGWWSGTPAAWTRCSPATSAGPVSRT